jgi:hypothetical protein
MTSGGRRRSGCCSACSEQAAEAWRAHAGDTDSTVAVVDDPADLRCLVELDTDEMLVRGDEPRRVMDNWFRADARISGLDRTQRSQGRPLPAAASLYHDLDVTVLTRPVSDWHVRTLGSHLTRRWSTRGPPSGWRGAAGDLVLGLPGSGPLTARADWRLDPR